MRQLLFQLFQKKETQSQRGYINCLSPLKSSVKILEAEVGLFLIQDLADGLNLYILLYTHQQLHLYSSTVKQYLYKTPGIEAETRGRVPKKQNSDSVPAATIGRG